MKKRLTDWMTGFAEQILGCKIYRNSLPHGTDMVEDLVRAVGRERIEIIFDVGANIGQSAQLFAESFPAACVYSFEPVAATFDTMRASVEKLSQVRPFQLALGNSVGETEISIDKSYSTMNSMKADRGGKTEKIQCSTVDLISRQHRVEKIDLLKIDVEGYELEVLEGARDILSRQNVAFVYIECAFEKTEHHFVPFERINSVLFPYGYKIFGLYEQQMHWDGRRELMYFNAMYISPKIAELNESLTSHHKCVIASSE